MPQPASDHFSTAPLARYSGIAIALHWIVALLLIGNVVLGWVFESLADDMIRPAINLHKSVGILVLGLVVLRILWRLSHAAPPFSLGMAKWEKALAHITHFGLYVLMLAMPITGWLHDSAWNKAAEVPMYLFGMFQWPRLGFIMNLPPETKERLHDLFGEMHEVAAWGLVALFVLHLIGALKHQFFDREQALQRMLPGNRVG